MIAPDQYRQVPSLAWNIAGLAGWVVGAGVLGGKIGKALGQKRFFAAASWLMLLQIWIAGG